jgi:hypothetical protein
MTKFLANWEVESDIILPPEVPVLRYEHPTELFTAFLRNIPEERSDLTFLSMQLVFSAPSLTEAKLVGEQLAKEFLNYLCFTSNLKVRLRSILQIFNWEPNTTGIREALYYSRSYAQDDAPYEALDQTLLETINLLQTHPITPRVRRALKWFANGITSIFPDDQFTYFWFVIELIAQVIKEPTPVSDKCPTCANPLYCPHCNATPLHRPYPKQAIEQLFHKYINDKPAEFYNVANEARNLLLHGEEVSTVEARHGIEFSRLVNDVGRLAYISIINQFVPVLVNRQPTPMFLQASHYVRMNMSGVAHFQIGFTPDLQNPDPALFPKVQMTVDRVPRNEITDRAPEAGQ